MKEIIFFSIIFILSFSLTYFYKNWAKKRLILDLPNYRKCHSEAIPCGGGIAFIIPFYLGISYLFLNNQIDKNLYYALLPGLLLTLLGIADDVKDISPSIRLVFQILCAGISLYFLRGFQGLFRSDLMYLWALIAVFGIVWFINLFNFLDGSDGYASMEAISISLALWFFTGTNVLLLLVFSIGGFLYWNWPKAKIFMGDTGSITLGFILIVFGIHFHNNGDLHFQFWILITALFWFDATFTLLRRINNKENLSQAHRNHIFQRAILGGYSHLKTLIFGLGINSLLFFICLVTWLNYIPLFPGFLLLLLILGFAMYYVEQKYAFKS